MPEQVQIFLIRPLTVNLGSDEHGRAITTKLDPGLQHVDQEIADNWFVKAHCQELTDENIQKGELQQQLNQALSDLKILQGQLDQATEMMNHLTAEREARDTEIEHLKIQLTKAQQAQVNSVQPDQVPKSKGKL